MPLSVTLKQDPQSHFPLHSGFLTEKLYQPPSKIWMEAKEEGLDYYYKLMNLRELESRRNILVPPKNLITWFFEFIQSIQGVTNEDFHFEFAYYIHAEQCNEESEYVIRASPPMWFVTISDFEKSIVHKNWTIAFDNWGDVLIKRGPATSNDPMSNAPNFKHREEMTAKLFSAIKEHTRLRNFRLAREQKIK